MKYIENSYGSPEFSSFITYIKANYPMNILDVCDKTYGIIINNVEIRSDYADQGLEEFIIDSIIAFADEVQKIVAVNPSSKSGKTVELFTDRGFIKNSGKNFDVRFSHSYIRHPQYDFSLEIDMDMDMDDDTED